MNASRDRFFRGTEGQLVRIVFIPFLLPMLVVGIDCADCGTAHAAGFLHYSGKGVIESSLIPEIGNGEPFEFEMLQNTELPDLDPRPQFAAYTDPCMVHTHTVGEPSWNWRTGYELATNLGIGAAIVTAIHDDSPGDMGTSPLGTRFVTELRFEPGSFATLGEIASATFLGGSLRVFDPSAGLVAVGSIYSLLVEPVPETGTLSLTAVGLLLAWGTRYTRGRPARLDRAEELRNQE